MSRSSAVSGEAAGRRGSVWSFVWRTVYWLVVAEIAWAVILFAASKAL